MNFWLGQMAPASLRKATLIFLIRCKLLIIKKKQKQIQKLNKIRTNTMILFSINSAAKILPKRSTEPGGISFKNSCQKAADLLSLTIDGKQKEFEASTTYANIKTILKNIQKSAYFEKLNQPQQPAENMELRKYSLAHNLLERNFFQLN